MKIRVTDDRPNRLYSFSKRLYSSWKKSLWHAFFQKQLRTIYSKIPKATLKALVINSSILLIIGLIIVFSFPNLIKEKLIVFSKNLFNDSVAVNAKEADNNIESLGFLELIESEKNNLIYLSVSDEAYENLTDEVKNKLIELGSKKIDELKYRGSYVAVIANGQVINEDVNNNGVARLEYRSTLLESAGYDNGNYSKILIRGKNLSPNKTGINVVYQDTHGTLKKSVFDFHSFPNPRSEPILIGPAPTEFRNIQIIIKETDYTKIRNKRAEALKVGILLTSDDDYVPAQLRHLDSIYDVKIRLKGDWVDHLENEKKWSYRIDLKGESTLFGMSKFSIHHPKTRNYMGEWVYHQALKREGIIGLRYSFLNAELKILGDQYDSLLDLGTYAMEESFDKYLIENNNRREGVIIKLNENLMWEGTAQARMAGLNANFSAYQLSNYNNMTILPFSEKKILRDSSLSNMFKIARNLFYEFIAGNRAASDIFDLEKLAKYNALSNLLGANHALRLHNQRIYFNPIIAKFEPIGFDAFAGIPLTMVEFYPKSSTDLKFLKAFAEELEKVSDPQYLDNLLGSLGEIDSNIELLNMEFSNITFDKKVLYQNQKVIEKGLYPSTAFHAFLTGLTDESISLNLRSITPFPVEIIALSYKGQRILAKTRDLYILKPKSKQLITFYPSKHYKNLFVSKKTKKVLFSSEEDIEDLVVTYRTYGTSKIKTQHIIPWREKEKNFLKSKLFSLRKENYQEFDFLIVDENKKTITFKSGPRILSKDLIIPKDYTVIANAGLSLNLKSEAKIISYSPLIFKGTDENPIQIYSSDNTGQGILVIGAKLESQIIHVNFTNLSNPSQQGWEVTGSVNFYESPVKFKYVIFEKNRSEDALNIIRSNFEIDKAIFKDTRSDAFDGDFVTGSISNTLFKNLGNDAVDISGSEVMVINVTIIKAGDKGLSGGENSKLIARNVKIYNSEIGVASKDQSVVKIDSIYMNNCELGYTAFQKKSEFGSAEIKVERASSENIRVPFLIESHSLMHYNNTLIKTQENVIGKLYGKEFGKSSE